LLRKARKDGNSVNIIRKIKAIEIDELKTK